MKIQQLTALAGMVIVLGALPLQSAADEKKEEKTEIATKILSKQVGSECKIILYKRSEPIVYKLPDKTSQVPGELYWLEVERPKRKKPVCAWAVHLQSHVSSELRDFMIAERDKDKVAIAFMYSFCVFCYEVDLTEEVPFPSFTRTRPDKDLSGPAIRPLENSPTFIPTVELVRNRYGIKAYTTETFPNLTSVA